MSHRLFAQLAFERALGNAAIEALATALKRGYQRLLPHALHHSRVVMGAAGLLLVGTLATFPLMGRAFLPAFNEGALVISAVTLPGTSLAESNALGSAIERLLLEVPEVVATARRTGRAELDEHVQGVESAEIDVRLEPGGLELWSSLIEKNGEVLDEPTELARYRKISDRPF